VRTVLFRSSPSLEQRVTNSFQDRINGGQLAAAWGTRETLIVVVTKNLPMISPLLRTWFAPFLPTTRPSSDKDYNSPGIGFVTIGGGGASKNSRQGVQTVSRITANMTFDNESEERIVSGTHDINLQSLQSPRRHRPMESWCRKR
jgi:hypothetical protein